MNFETIRNLSTNSSENTKAVVAGTPGFGSRPIFLVFLLLFAAATSLFAQTNFQHTKNKVDQTLKSNARVNPSTLAMELSVPIADLPGRGGAAQPLVFDYTSKVWELRATGATFGPPNYPVEALPVYSDKAMAGWTSSYGIPKIDSTLELHDCSGFAATKLQPLPDGCGQYYYVKKVSVTLPGGAAQELRKDDLLHTTTTGTPDKTGIYYAVDGSRSRLEWAANGAATLFLANGGRYLFDAAEDCYAYTDRNGNKLDYDKTTGAWTDTLGRTIHAPIPFTPAAAQNQAAGTESFTVPGLGTSDRQYHLVWKKLSGGALDAGQSLAYDASQCNPPVSRTPKLFEDTHDFKACSALAGYFDPVVLTGIILPNGQKYEFAYSKYGEITRIDYPGGGYEKFIYAQVRALGWDYEANSFVAESYAQSNRGVVDRYVGAGDGAAEQHWHYQVEYVTVGGQAVYQITTTNPDLTIGKRRLHRSRTPLLDGQNGTWGFDTALAGREIETQMLDAAGTMRVRKLFEWEVTAGASPAANALPERDARLTREITVISEPGSSNAVAQMTETVYDTHSDQAYFARLNAKQTKNYDYVVLNLNQAQTSTAAQIAALFGSSQINSTSEADYLYQAEYKARNINGLMTESRIKDASGTVRAKSQIFYDEAAYPLIDYGAAAHWEDPNTVYRGNITTTKSYTDAANNLSIQTHAQYDNFGNPRKSWDGRGNAAESEYSAAYAYAYLTKVTSPGANGSSAGFSTTTAYDPKTGLPVSMTDANNQTSYIEYNDLLLRPTKVTAPNGQQTITEYGAGTNAATRYVKTRAQIDQSNWKEGYGFYDGLGRTIKTQSVEADGDVFVDTQYDAYGRVWRTSNPHRANDPVYWTENFYDAAGRVDKVKTADDAYLTTAYAVATAGDVIGTVVTVTDQAGKQRRSITDAFGQLKRVDEPDDYGNLNVPTYYGYTLGNLTSVLQGAQPRNFAYDGLSRLKSATNPESGTIYYSYDANGNLTSKTDARNITTTYAYDNLNRVTQRSYSDNITPTVNYYYDDKTYAKGLLTKVTNGISTTEYTVFDQMGRVTSHKQTTDGAAYTTGYVYNLSGGLIEETYPSGRVVKTTLDADGDLSKVESRKTGATLKTYADNFAYTAAGAVSSMKLGNGNWESTVFNNRLQPIQIALGTSQNATNLLQLGFTYGGNQNNGNVVSQTITSSGFSATQTYNYDSLNRIKDATEMTGSTLNWKQTFTYDRYGNRNFNASQTTTLGNCAANVCNPSIDPANNRINASGYVYDNAGNMTNDPQLRAFTYDGENKQTKVVQQGATVGEYFYDGDGKRVKKISYTNNQPTETTIFVYDAGGKMVAEYSTDPVPAGQAKVNYPTSDHLGSPRINTDANGAVIAKHDYMPFGEEVNRAGYGADNLRQRFTSYERDTETELDFAKNRYHNYNLGRFTSPDPYKIVAEIEFEKTEEKARAKLNNYLGKPQQWNAYVYTINNPLKYTDPTGEYIYLSGSAEEVQKKLERIKNLLGEERFNRIQKSSDGKVLLISREDVNGFANIGGTVEEKEFSKKFAEILSHSHGVQFNIGKEVMVKADINVFGNQNYILYDVEKRGGGGVTLKANESVSGDIEIWVSPNAAQAGNTKASSENTSRLTEDGSQLRFPDNRVVDGHEFGHAYDLLNGLPDGTNSVIFENAVRAGIGNTQRRKSEK